MNAVPRKIFLAAILILTGMYFFPVWQISLNAPQYPEGIGLYIWLDTITGQSPNDLNNINGLNHYIGMKQIVPDAIPELKIMPFLLAFMIILGLIAYITNKKYIIYIWLILFIGLMVGGLTDFYFWEYDYGHDLNPKAAIKIPGMSYQPPLLGTKQLLNMKTTSLPYIGGWIAAFSFLVVILSLYLDRKQKKSIEGKSHVSAD